MTHSTILSIPIRAETKSSILEKIQKFLDKREGFLHIVSLNPEILVSSTRHPEFRKVLSESEIKLVDGVGIALAGSILGIRTGERISGTNLMSDLLQNLHTRSLHVLLLGARGNLAEKLANCYSERFPKHIFKGLSGYEAISKPKPVEEMHVSQVIAEFQPDIVFVAFGAPYQELWLDRHRGQLKGAVGMGVGGAFEFETGVVPRAPAWLQYLGLEWMFRLIVQPWRWRRQLKLIEFIYLILKQKLS